MIKYDKLLSFQAASSPSVCLSAWNNSTPTGIIFMKLHFGGGVLKPGKKYSSPYTIGRKLEALDQAKICSRQRNQHVHSRQRIAPVSYCQPDQECNVKTNNLRQWSTWYKLHLFYNTFIIILYMFRALHAHHQEGELYWCSICYRHSQ